MSQKQNDKAYRIARGIGKCKSRSMNENTEEAIKNGQSGETGNIGYTRHKANTNKTKTQHNMCWTPPYANKHK